MSSYHPGGVVGQRTGPCLTCGHTPGETVVENTVAVELAVAGLSVEQEIRARALHDAARLVAEQLNSDEPLAAATVAALLLAVAQRLATWVEHGDNTKDGEHG